MKKEEILKSSICKTVGMKRSLVPYLFLVEMFGGDSDLPNPVDLTVEQLLKASPKEIAAHLHLNKAGFAWWAERSRGTRKSLRSAKEKLSKLGFTPKDGPFMSGIYFVTEWSPKEDWVQYFMSEYEVSKKEAVSAYDTGKKFDLI